MFLGNTLYAVAMIYYFYITFLGYNCACPCFFHDLTNSFTILARDAAVTASDSCDTDTVRYQFIWISCIQDHDGNVFSEIITFGIARRQICKIYYGG